MNPVVSYIKQTLQGYYPDTELVPMAKLLLTQVFGMSVVELYAGKDTTFSVNEQKRLDDIWSSDKTRTYSIYNRH